MTDRQRCAKCGDSQKARRRPGTAMMHCKDHHTRTGAASASVAVDCAKSDDAGTSPRLDSRRGTAADLPAVGPASEGTHAQQIRRPRREPTPTCHEDSLSKRAPLAKPLKEFKTVRAYDSPTSCSLNRSHPPLYGHRRSVTIACLQFVVPLLLMTAGARAPAALGGSITYNIVNYPELQNGYTVSGTITTDGQTGTITTADITSWDVSVLLSGVIQLNFTPTNSTASALLTATTTALTNPTTPPPQVLEFLDSSLPSTYIIWVGPSSSFYQSANFGASLWFSEWPTNGVIAASAVPEPSSFILLAVGAGAVIAHVWSRRGRRWSNDSV
jgi:hypothetical protein